jgi:hypothetical protein
MVLQILIIIVNLLKLNAMLQYALVENRKEILWANVQKTMKIQTATALATEASQTPFCVERVNEPIQTAAREKTLHKILPDLTNRRTPTLLFSTLSVCLFLG